MEEPEATKVVEAPAQIDTVAGVTTGVGTTTVAISKVNALVEKKPVTKMRYVVFKVEHHFTDADADTGQTGPISSFPVTQVKVPQMPV